MESSPEHAVASGSSQLIGHYHYDVLADRWTVSDEVYLIHGYAPGEVEFTADLLLAHKHPDDRDRAIRVVEDALMHATPFSLYHRILTRDGVVSSVAAVGTGIVDEHRDVVALEGFFIDMTPDVRRLEETSADQAVAASAEHRAAIEQAKGMLMLTYDIDADAAFAMLRWWSMECNIKLQLLAERVVTAMMISRVSDPETRAELNRVLESLARLPHDSANLDEVRSPSELGEPAVG